MIKVIKVTKCDDCPNCVQYATSDMWKPKKYYCNITEKKLETIDSIPENCQLENLND